MPANTRFSLSDAARGRRRFVAIGTLIAQVMAAVVAMMVVASPAHAGPSAVMYGYVPLPANDFQGSLKAINAAAGSTLDFTVGVTNAASGAIMYYDQWEDGYEPDIANPTQPTTLVFGDGNTANGNAGLYCSVCAGDVLPQGAALIMRNNVVTPRDKNNVFFDGSDKVASTRGFTITAGGFTTALGSLLAGVVSSYDTTKYSTDFTVPVGENTPVPSGTSNAFSYSGVIVQASQDGTSVSVDKNGDGTADVTLSADEGATVFVNGGINEGATIHATKPVQVHLVTGDKSASYEARTFTLFPDNLLSNDYMSPAGSSVNSFRTVNYLYNPSSSAITVTPTCTGCAGTISVPAKSSVAFHSPVGQAVRFTTSGAKFIGVAGVGSQSGAAPGGGSDSSSSWDWGFSMIPTSQLTTQVVLGWAPGNSNNPPASPAGDRGDNPVWVTTLSATTVRVDYDGNAATGSISTPDCFGAHHDAEISVAALASTRISDLNDGDMTGARIYTCDGTLISGSWGEDPATAPAGSPGFDAGYTIIPSTTMLVNKTSALYNDANNDGKYGPGDTMTYDISIADAGSLAFTNVKAKDDLPAGLTYVNGSTVFDDGSTVTPIPDDTTPPAASKFPLDEAGASVPSIAAGATVDLRFQAVIKNRFDSSSNVIGNTACVTAQEADACDSVSTSLVQADLELGVTQTASPSYVGDNAVFHVTLTNKGPDGATGVNVTDAVPANTTFVSANASQGSYDNSSGIWNVGTVGVGETKTLDITATVNATSAQDFAEVSKAQAVDPDSQPAEDQLDATHAPNQDDEGSVPVTVAPSADLSVTKALQTAPVHIGDNAVYKITVSNDGPSDATGVAATDNLPAGLTYVSDDASGAYNAGTGVWTVGNIANGSSRSLIITATANALNTENFAQVTAAGQHDPDSQPAEDPFGPGNPANQDDESSKIATTRPLADLSLAKSVAPGSVNQGQQTTYTLTVGNAGPSDATGVAVSDQLPAGVTFVSSAPSQGSYDATSGTWTVGSVSNGGTATLGITVRVDAAGSITNVAEISASNEDDPDSTPANGVPSEDDRASANVTGVPVIDLAVTDVASAPSVNVGSNVTYTVTVANSGPSDATGVNVRDALPAGVTYVSNNPSQGSYDSNTGIWTVGNVANGSSASLDITGRVTTPGSVPNFAEVTAAGQTDVDSQPAENALGIANAPDQDDEATVVVSGVQIDLELHMNANGTTFDQGKNVMYTITVGDTGPSDATGVKVKDVLPSGLAFVSAAPSQGSYDAAADTWTVGAVGIGQTKMIQVSASVHKAGAIVNSAEVSAASEPDVDSTPANGIVTEDDHAVVAIAGLAAAVVPPAPKSDPASVSGSLWLDKNSDGKAQSDEAMMLGVTVDLLDANGHVVAKAVTDDAGHYSFTNLAPGRYTIAIEASTLPSTITGQTYDPDSVLNSKHALTLASGAGVGGMNFGYEPATTGAGTLTIGNVKLPITGADIKMLVEAAGVMLLVGMCLIAIKRRRSA